MTIKQIMPTISINCATPYMSHFSTNCINIQIVKTSVSDNILYKSVR